MVPPWSCYLALPVDEPVDGDAPGEAVVERDLEGPGHGGLLRREVVVEALLQLLLDVLDPQLRVGHVLAVDGDPGRLTLCSD